MLRPFAEGTAIVESSGDPPAKEQVPEAIHEHSTGLRVLAGNQPEGKIEARGTCLIGRKTYFAHK